MNLAYMYNQYCNYHNCFATKLWFQGRILRCKL